jgi:4-diphosphocytidyl-2-C-methyl-D-erythritol kinase
MVVFPNCKVNLGLKILRKREDGFHDLETVFYPLRVCDVLEAVRSAEFGLHSTGRSIPGDPSQNLCIKAYYLLKKDFPDLPLIRIHLYKNLPIGGGLGGGSSDGAHMLQLLNIEFQLGLTPAQLQSYAAQLGSDCPFFLLNQPCLGTGRGQQLEPLVLDLSVYSFLIVHPGFHISTEDAFAKCTPDTGGRSLKEIISLPIARWAGELVNDFEKPVFQEYPSLRAIKEQLYRRGAIYAAMSGSGSSLFGIFGKDKADATGWGSGCEAIAVL